MDNKLNWCLEQKNGIKIIEPSENLSKEYISNAEETLKILNLIKNSNSNLWLATQKYYFEYFLAYSILMKIGIKSELHLCTIEIIKLFEEEDIISFNFSEILDRDKELRIANQYYLKNIKINIDLIELRDLMLKVLNILDKIDSKKTKRILTNYLLIK